MHKARIARGPRGSGLDSCIKPELHETRPDPRSLTLGPRAWRLPVAIPSWREKRDGVFPLPEPYFWSLHGECPTFRPMCQRSRIISCRGNDFRQTQNHGLVSRIIARITRALPMPYRLLFAMTTTSPLLRPDSVSHD